MKPSGKFGSDLVVDILKALGIEYFSFNPGSTFRELQESLVNHGGNHPEILLCLHEEIAVAVAQGYAAAARKPMAVGLHDLVGLQHASMAIYNAWIDKVPIILLGGGSPLDPTKRKNRPEWLLSAIVPGELVRNFVKWDDHIIGHSSLPDSLLRAYRVAMTQPQGPVFICLDQDMQESSVTEAVEIPFSPATLKPTSLSPDPDVLYQVASQLLEAEMPIILADRMGHHPETTPDLVQLAELLAAPVVDLWRRFNFPNNHPLDLTDDTADILSRADLLLALEVEDLWGYLHKVGSVRGESTSLLNPRCKIIDISLRDLATKGWVQNYQRLQVADISLTADTAAAVPQLVNLCQQMAKKQHNSSWEKRRQWIEKRHHGLRKQWQQEAERRLHEKPIAIAPLVHEVWAAVENDDWVLSTANLTLSQWARRLWIIDKPYQFVPSVGMGLGRGMGVSIGAALANRGTGRLVIDLQADGDLLYTPQAIWTAAHYEIPLVVIMYNNLCYGNSLDHFRMTAMSRGRSEEGKGKGTYIEKPIVDFSAMARSFGAYAEGPIVEPQEIRQAVKRAVNEARENSMPAVVDIICRRDEPRLFLKDEFDGIVSELPSKK